MELQPVKHDFMFVFFHAILLFLYFWIPCDIVSYVYAAGDRDIDRLEMQG